MALKDYKKREVGKIGNATDIVWWEKKGAKVIDKLELYKADSIDGLPWGVEQRTLGKKQFKTRPEALKFALEYMRKN